MNKRFNQICSWLDHPVSSAPLATFRVVFGAVMVFSTLRYGYLGWIEQHFIDTKFTFKFYGFEWVQLLPPAGMYALFTLMSLGALGVMLGLYYRLSAAVFFATFTYSWLIDLTYYLNHYYFISIIAFLLLLVPANRRFALDCLRRPGLTRLTIPRWMITIFKWQIAIVYIYAGLAKINSDWLIEALPLKIWLPANDQIPLLGSLFAWHWAPWLFSWLGMLYDTTIVFWLSWARTRTPAYLSVIVFHGLTGILFQIGVFPLVMIGATWIFFSEKFHERLLGYFRGLSVRASAPPPTPPPKGRGATSHGFFKLKRGDTPLPFGGGVGGGADERAGFALTTLIVLHFAIQLLFPWRYLLYPGNLFWTEEGYRFSWRVMLMEKAGTATFYVRDSRSGREGAAVNGDFLCSHQEKQMAMQPDMILQFAHFLKKYYAARGVYQPRVRAEVYVTLNARPSRLLIDSELDLTTVRDGWAHKPWILDKVKM